MLRLPQLDLELSTEPSDTLVDCGANVGQVTSQFALTGAQVHSFEPNPLCYRTLCERFRLVRNVTIHNAGVMDKNQTLRFRVPLQMPEMNWETSVAGSFHFYEDDDESQYQTYEVPCIDLNAWILARPDRIKVLKLDIEGSEIAVINKLIDTGTVAKIDLIACETHDAMIPDLADATAALRERVKREGLGDRVRLDWP